jgi:hypothetical protein
VRPLILRRAKSSIPAARPTGGFRLRSERPDLEGMLYYRAAAVDLDTDATLSA